MSASHNGYGYVHGNPVNLTDASGEFAWLALIGIIVGAIYINDWRGQTYANQMQGISFWDAVSYANNRPCPACETVLSMAFPFLDTAFSARDFGYALSQGTIDVLSLLAMLPLLDKRRMQAADDLAAMARRGLRQGLDDLPSSIEVPAEQRTLDRIFSNDLQMDEAARSRLGSGGNWSIVGEEVADPKVVHQTNELMCVPACGEMLAREHGFNIPQFDIAQRTGFPTDIAAARDALNQLDVRGAGVWRGGYVAPEAFERLNATRAWGAEIYSLVGGRAVGIGHMVVVQGVVDDLVEIWDPWGLGAHWMPEPSGTVYRMQVDTFLRHWNGGALWFREVMP